MMHEKIILVKNIETENFSVAIDWESIEHQSSQADSNQKILIAILIDLKTGSIESLEKLDFWKTEHFNAETPQNTLFYKKKCMSMRRKVFQKHLNSAKIFQNQNFQSICPQKGNIKHILH